MNDMQRLLVAVQDRQIDPDDDFDDLDFAIQVRDLLARGEPMPSQLERRIQSTPSARAIFRRLRAERIAKARVVWRDRGFATRLERRAADSEDDVEALSAAGVTVRTIFNSASGKWLISLQLTADAANDLPPGLSVRLSDSGGQIWLEGPLDRRGGIDGFWPLDDVSPRRRLREHGLVIDLI